MKQSSLVLEELFKTIDQRKGADEGKSYTAKLFKKGRKKIAQKVGEEGVECALAGVGGDKGEIVSESADLFYHLFVLWSDAGVKPEEVYGELAKRFGVSGLDEKRSRGKA